MSYRYETTQRPADHARLPSHDWQARELPRSETPYWRCTRCHRADLGIPKPPAGSCLPRPKERTPQVFPPPPVLDHTCRHCLRPIGMGEMGLWRGADGRAVCLCTPTAEYYHEPERGDG